MLTLGYFTKFPSRYRHREDSLKNVTFIDISKEVEEDGIIIRSNTGKYAQEIKIFDTAIRLKSPCKVYCSCESFKFEFAHPIFRSGSLLKPISFVRSIINRPRERNEFNIPSGCKHIVALARMAPKIK